jgi:hypothetical protein
VACVIKAHTALRTVLIGGPSKSQETKAQGRVGRSAILSLWRTSSRATFSRTCRKVVREHAGVLATHVGIICAETIKTLLAPLPLRDSKIEFVNQRLLPPLELSWMRSMILRCDERKFARRRNSHGPVFRYASRARIARYWVRASP